MANPFTQPTLANFNANPPSDDGLQQEQNRVTWNTHVLGKVGNPLRTFAEAISTNVLAGFDKIFLNGVSTQAATFTVTQAQQGTLFPLTGTITGNLPSAATVGSNFTVAFSKDGASGVATIDPDGSETIDGLATLTLTRSGESFAVVSDGANWRTFGRVPPSLLRNFFDGFEMSNDAGGDPQHDIIIQPGQASDSTNAVTITLASQITKRIDASFTEGSGGGGLDTGTVAADTDYHLHVIAKDDGTTDVLFSLSSTAPTLPTDFTVFRRIGQIRTDSSANIVNDRFSQVNSLGERFISESVATTSGTTSDILGIPSGMIKIKGHLTDTSQDTANSVLTLVMGDSGGFETTGYTGNVSTEVHNNVVIVNQFGGSAFEMTNNTQFDAPAALSGDFLLENIVDNDWSLRSENFFTTAAVSNFLTGRKSLSAEIDRLRLTTAAGTAAFDAGSWRVIATTY